MSEPTPAPAPAPEDEPSGFLGRIRAWFEKDVEPDLQAVKGDVEKIQALGPELSAIANTVVALAKAADPAAAPDIAALVAGAEKAAGVIAEIVSELSDADL